MRIKSKLNEQFPYAIIDSEGTELFYMDFNGTWYDDCFIEVSQKQFEKIQEWIDSLPINDLPFEFKFWMDGY